MFRGKDIPETADKAQAYAEAAFVKVEKHLKSYCNGYAVTVRYDFEDHTVVITGCVAKPGIDRVALKNAAQINAQLLANAPNKVATSQLAFPGAVRRGEWVISVASLHNDSEAFALCIASGIGLMPQSEVFGIAATLQIVDRVRSFAGLIAA